MMLDSANDDVDSEVIMHQEVDSTTNPVVSNNGSFNYFTSVRHFNSPRSASEHIADLHF